MTCILDRHDVELLLKIAGFWLERVGGPRPQVDRLLARVRKTLERAAEGPRRGGIARARRLSPERRTAIARAAAEALWAKRRAGV